MFYKAISIFVICIVLESDLEKAGLLIYEHLSPTDIEERYFKGRTDYYHAFENINYILAVVGNK